jgi:DNA-binding NtrC family response regulator
LLLLPKIGDSMTPPLVRKIEGALDPKIQSVLFEKTVVVEKSLLPLLPIVRPHAALENQLDEIRVMSKMSGKSPKIKEIFLLIEKMAKSTSNVLLMGESGTGKEMVAVAIHEKSDRNRKQFVAINCSSIPAQLLESELFGHKRGSFTGAQEARRGLFEEANGGTIFLDEIGDMPLELQSKLLRVIQEREITPVGENKPRSIDVRIIAATHKDLERMVNDGKFRQDLFYRLSVVPIRLPALRDRKEDIPLLAAHFLEKYCAKGKAPQKTFTAAALAKLIEQDWPGNVRELENSIERAVVLSDNHLIDEGEILDAQTIERQKETVGVFAKLMTLEDMEKCYILYVLAHTGEQKDKAAKILGIDRKTLYRREVAYGLEQPPSDM